GELWAVGASPHGTGLTSTPDTILHLRAGSWTATPGPVGATLKTFHMASPSDGWLMGEIGDPGARNSAQKPFIMHYDGVAWKQAPSSADSQSDLIEMFTESDGWAVEESVPQGFPESTGAVVTHVQHFHNGRWET